MESLASTCGRHPGVAVTGFCAVCLRERLAGLDPATSKAPHLPPELRRCKSFSYARSAVGYLDAHRRSCDVRQETTQAGTEIDACVPEEEEARQIGAAGFSERPMKDHMDQESSRKIAGSFWGAASVFGKRWQEWRRKHKLKKQHQEGSTSRAAAAAMPPPEKARRQRHRFRDTQSEVAMDALGRRSCDVDPRFSLDAGRVSVDAPKYSLDEPTASWDAYSVAYGGRPVLAHLPPMLSVFEEVPVPRSDGQIPVEEDDMVPGGSAQTRDYYLDSSSRRRRSLDRSSSVRKSFSDGSEPPRMIAGANANARVSPAISTEFYHYHHVQSVLDHDFRDLGPNSLQDGISEGFESAFRDNSKGMPAKKTKKWIKALNIWGLIQKKGNSREAEAAGVADRPLPESWPELRARGYNGQMLRCNSSMSARSSFSASAAISGSGRRSSVDMHANGYGRMRRDEILLERNLSARYSPSGTDNGTPQLYLNPVGGNQIGRRNGVPGKGRPARSSNSLSRSKLQL